MDRSSADSHDLAQQLEEELSAARAERESLRADQAEWEQVRSQVEGSLADLERRLFEQAERLQSPRGAEEFQQILNEQLALAVQRQEAAEQRADELARERNDLVVALRNAEVDAPHSQDQGPPPPEVLGELRSANQECERLRVRIAELESQPSAPAEAPTNETEQRLRERSEHAEAELRKSRDRVAALEHELAFSQTNDPGGSDEEVASLRNERDELERRLDEASDRLLSIAGAHGELSNLRRDLESCTGERDQQTRLAEQRQAQLAEAQSALEALQAEADELRQANDQAATQREEVDRLAAETRALAADRDAHQQQAAALEAQLAEWTEAAEAVAAERDGLAAAHGDLSRVVDSLRRELADSEAVVAELAAARGQVESLQQQLTNASAAAAAAAADRDALQADHESLGQRAEQLEQRLDEARQQQGDLRDRLEAAEGSAGELDRQRERADELQSQLESARAAIAEADAQSARVRSDNEGLNREREDLQRRVAESEHAGAELGKLRDKHEETVAALKRQRDRVGKLEQELSEWAAGSQQDSDEVNRLRAERDELAARLANAETAPDNGAELATLQDKFDLAIADLREHRQRVTTLEEQLASGAGSQDDLTAELDRLRAERDELARQLEDAAVGAEPSEEMADLRARFEMAVDDVRRLKNENTELQNQLASGDSSPNASGESDWEAQKRRLLASLEGEGEADEPERVEERATIAGTIQITDQVVAEKDREIEQLRASLESGGGSATAPAAIAADHEANALLDEDAIIQAERDRLANLEADLREKLREAELELSVERAKISRTQSELAEQQIELETLRAATEAADEAAAGAAPKRRWLDKLGLGGEGE